MSATDARHGQTPLHCCAQSGRAQIAAKLLEAGADRTIKNYKGLLPYEIADNQGYFECREILKFLPPVIHNINIRGCTHNSISLSWDPPVLNPDTHARIEEYGLLHEPLDIKR